MRFVGIDGCPKGWVAVAWSGPDGGPTTAHHLPTLAALDTAVPDAAVVGIDMPLFVPGPDGRPAEGELRAFLGPRRSSVFATPTRAAFDCRDYASANEASRASTGKGISRQAWALVPKIREAQEWLTTTSVPSFEAHPEACFAEMLGGPAKASKKTWAGMKERYDACRRAGIDLDDLDTAAGVAALTDDLLDAAAAAWTAWRFWHGEARPFPAEPDRGSEEDVIWA